MLKDRDILPGSVGRRPLTARSVVASTLLGVDPPRLPGSALVRSGELFGLRPGATRTALSRMAANGEVVARDGDYELTGRLLERHARQRSARRPRSRPWDGTWELAIVREGRRSAADRGLLRDAARRRGLAEVREGCWTRPANLDPGREPASATVIRTWCILVRDARPEDQDAFLDAFALEEWAAEADVLIDAMTRTQHLLDDRRADQLGPTFELSATVLRHLVADPVLPTELLPVTWPGDALRSTYERYETGFQATWRAWFQSFRDEQG